MRRCNYPYNTNLAANEWDMFFTKNICLDKRIVYSHTVAMDQYSTVARSVNVNTETAAELDMTKTGFLEEGMQHQKVFAYYTRVNA